MIERLAQIADELDQGQHFNEANKLDDAIADLMRSKALNPSSVTDTLSLFLRNIVNNIQNQNVAPHEIHEYNPQVHQAIDDARLNSDFS